MTLSHIYADLGSQFSQKSLPVKVAKPQNYLWNKALAEQLDLQISNDQIPSYFSGQKLLQGSTPIAMAYSGHQFGHFNPQLGDGRAHLLGELTDADGEVQEIQLKGSGQTPYSRNGDGKCGIKPAIREYIMSEALHAMRVPTSRCLAVVTTGEDVYRQVATPGAVVTRVASSHLRVGTFEYFAARKMHKEVKALADLCIDRHFSELVSIDSNDKSKYLNLLGQVIDKQIILIVEWMRIGFIHGVMNTDNTLLSGATIDYGPCAMLGIYDPETVFSSIDHNGRYAFKNQPWIAQWNMARLAECLIPLIADDEQSAINSVMPLLENYKNKFNHAYELMMSKKLGFNDSSVIPKSLIQPLLDLMYKNQMDYTQTFVALQASLNTENREGALHSTQDTVQKLSHLNEWREVWLSALNKQGVSIQKAMSTMTHNNPVVIPRNHHIEAILDHAEKNLTTEAVNPFLNVLRSPYAITNETHKFQDASPDGDLNYQTFCGT